LTAAGDIAVEGATDRIACTISGECRLGERAAHACSTAARSIIPVMPEEAADLQQPASSDSESQVADGVEHQLEPAWIRLQYIRTALALLISTPILVAGLVVALTLSAIPTSLAPALWTLLALKLLFNTVKGYWWPKVRYHHARYMVDENGVQIRSGVLNRVVTSVPRSRVQHVDLSQGIWERRLGLASLTIHTAASGHSEVDLEGIGPATAAQIRDYLLPQDSDDAA
jgi:membrane protein YdbS with pleckstrin-like domain